MFAKLFAIMESKEFVESDYEIPEGNIIVGVFSPLERACYAFVTKHSDISTKLNELGKCESTSPNMICLEMSLFEQEDGCPFRKELSEIAAHYLLRKKIEQFMSALMESRLEASKRGIEQIHLNSKFRITTANKLEPPDTIEVFQGFETMSLEDMLHISLKGTFLEPVLVAMESDDVFVDGTKSILDGETYFRDMNFIEKIIWSVYFHTCEDLKIKSDEIKKIIEGDAFISVGSMLSFRGGSVDAENIHIAKDDNHPDAKKVSQLKKEALVLSKNVDFMSSLFWDLVIATIPQEMLASHNVKAIRKGYKIVLSDEK